MASEISFENQRRIKKGIRNMPCPECNDSLSIDEEDLPSGGKGVVYQCRNKDCSVGGTVLISGLDVLKNALAKHTVKAVIIAYGAVFAFFGTILTPGTANERDSIRNIRPGLIDLGYFSNDDEVLDANMVNYATHALQQLEDYRDILEFQITDHGYTYEDDPYQYNNNSEQIRNIYKKFSDVHEELIRKLQIGDGDDITRCVKHIIARLDQVDTQY